MTKRTCLDCFHLKARIPLIHTSNAIVNARLDWPKATARCDLGFHENNDGSIKIFKNILKHNISQYRQAFREAERCAFYDTEL